MGRLYQWEPFTDGKGPGLGPGTAPGAGIPGLSPLYAWEMDGPQMWAGVYGAKLSPWQGPTPSLSWSLWPGQ